MRSMSTLVRRLYARLGRTGPLLLATALFLVVPAAARAQVLVVAPHPDDDIIIASGIIQRALARNETVWVVFVTNGDHAGVSTGTLRQGEAVSAQAALGLIEDRLIFLGYPDGHIFDIRDCWRYPWECPNPNGPYVTQNGVSETYASRGLGRTDYHRYRFGTAGSYRWETMIADMTDILTSIRPTHIFTTSQWDTHLDHEATFFLVQTAGLQAMSAVAGYNPTIHKTTVWPGDTSWPAAPDPTAYFTEIPKPPFTNRWGANPLTWDGRESLDVPLAMQSAFLPANPKFNAIAAHASQGGMEEYIGRWLHKDEFFWTEQLAGTNRPPVPNAGSAQQVAEGVAVVLNGSASFDPDATALTYQWRQVAGPAVTLSNPAAVQPSFIAPAGLPSNVTLAFELVVSDGALTSVPDAVAVVVQSSTPPPTYGANVAPLAVIAASSQRSGSGQTANKVADGVAQGYPTDATREWVTNGQGVGAWLTMTWTEPVTVSKLVLYDRPNTSDQMTAGVITFSDGSTLAVGPLVNGGGAVEYPFAARTISSLRLDVTGVSTSTGNVGLAEFEVFEVGGSNRPPVANAGPDQTVTGGATVSLNGTGSTDPNHDLLAYSWAQLSGPVVTLSNATSATPTFTAPAAAPQTQVMRFRLIVSDGQVSSPADTVDIRLPGTTDLPPTSNAGPDVTVSAGWTVDLEGSGADPDGQPVTYHWSQTGGTPITLSNTSSARLTFVVPSNFADQALTFRLLVHDGLVWSAPDSVTVNVVALPAAENNIAPTATVTASTQRAPTQSAAKAIDGSTLGYPVDSSREWATVAQRNGAWIELRWAASYVVNRIRLHDRPNTGDQVLSGTLTFSDGTSVPVGTLPNDGAAGDVLVAPRRVYWVRFTVDSTSAGTSNVGLAEFLVFQVAGTVPDLPPIANAGPDQTVAGASVVTLNGSASIDPDGAPLTYLWSQVSGSPVMLSATTTPSVTFTAPPMQLNPQQLAFQLLVSDGSSTSVADTVNVTVAGQTSVAEFATATASSIASTTQSAAKAIDRIISGYPNNSAAEWASNRERAGAWLQLDWTSNQTVNRIRLYDRPNTSDQITGATLLFSDGSSVAVGALPNDGSVYEISFAARTIRWVRLRVDTTSASTGRVGLSEIEVFPQ